MSDDDRQACKPTVGEVRRIRRGRYKLRLFDVSRVVDGVAYDRFGWAWRDPSRIVEVAPCNRARVTAGPTWMERGR